MAASTSSGVAPGARSTPRVAVTLTYKIRLSTYSITLSVKKFTYCSLLLLCRIASALQHLLAMWQDLATGHQLQILIIKLMCLPSTQAI